MGFRRIDYCRLRRDKKAINNKITNNGTSSGNRIGKRKIVSTVHATTKEPTMKIPTPVNIKNSKMAMQSTVIVATTKPHAAAPNAILAPKKGNNKCHPTTRINTTSTARMSMVVKNRLRFGESFVVFICDVY